ncbi:MAG: YihY/virulence factor BrkB family protein [Verrucomicrobia bacterium]|nr:YihY/virulence factor BrkB family protein [Verrucomicrobiota bacterium]MDA1066589.1 YihY/virulence factor BrkB family protein [Verrucomicrobiota bacterium]
MSALGTIYRTKWKDPYRRFRRILKKEIWETGHEDRNKATEFAYYVLRILSLVKTGFIRNNVFVRSAALCYSSLLALGPLAAIVLLVAGIIMEQVERAKMLELMNNFVIFLAPPLGEYFESSSNLSQNTLINENLLNGLDGFIESAKSGAFGVIGLLLLVVIAIQLFMAIEKAFNDIWGVRRGRGMFQSVGSYWIFITLGGFVFIAALAVYSAGTYVQLVEGLPFGEHILRLIQWLAPLLSLLIILILLASFYRFIPNTQVYFLPALSGAFIVSILLVLNKKLSFLYVKYVVNQESLYGSLGIIPILMIALYVFWVIILIGGQITYAIQNANFLANQQAWENTSRSTREVLSLAALILVARRFKACKPAYSSPELSKKLRVPGQILNESLANLMDMGFITVLTSEVGRGNTVKRYQPAKPLTKINLFEFKKALDDYGNSEGKELILDVDPLIREYSNKAEMNIQNDWETKTLEDLLETGVA